MLHTLVTSEPLQFKEIIKTANQQPLWNIEIDSVISATTITSVV